MILKIIKLTRADKTTQITIAKICSFKSSKLPLIKNPSPSAFWATTLGFTLALAKSPVAIPPQIPPIPCKEKASKESSHFEFVFDKTQTKITKYRRQSPYNKRSINIYITASWSNPYKPCYKPTKPT